MMIQSLEQWTPSQLTVARPDIWLRALDLAHAVTGVEYVDKRPLPDGTIYACGGGGGWRPLVEQEPEPEPLDDADRIEKANKEIRKRIKRIRKELDDIESLLSPTAYVPSGAMEWLLHEVGHWLAASDAERTTLNESVFGYDTGSDLYAFAFEDAVLEPFGSAREFPALSHRGGPAYDVTGPLPEWAFRHIDKRMAEAGVSVEPFRQLWSEWVRWGRAQGHEAPWLT